MPDEAVTTPQEGSAEVSQADKLYGETKPAEDVKDTKEQETKETETKEPDKQDQQVTEYKEFTVPEGVQIEPSFKGEFTELAKNMNLSQENAQKFIDLAAKFSQHQAEKTLNDWAAQCGEWYKEVKNDPEYGGVKFDETVERARRFYSKVGSPELTIFLKSTGFGDHPELIKMAVKADKLLGESAFVEPDKKGTTEPLSPAERLYGKK